jgi:hypothetical protein
LKSQGALSTACGNAIVSQFASFLSRACLGK